MREEKKFLPYEKKIARKVRSVFWSKPSGGELKHLEDSR